MGTGKILSVRNSVVDPYTVQIFVGKGEQHSPATSPFAHRHQFTSWKRECDVWVRWLRWRQLWFGLRGSTHLEILGSKQDTASHRPKHPRAFQRVPRWQFHRVERTALQIHGGWDKLVISLRIISNVCLCVCMCGCARAWPLIKIIINCLHCAAKKV